MRILGTEHLLQMYVQSDDNFRNFNFAVESFLTPRQQTDSWLLSVTCTPVLTHMVEACGKEGQAKTCRFWGQEPYSPFANADH